MPLSTPNSTFTDTSIQDYDKTSYKIMPTPPSPTHSSPSLTQSISLSSTSQAFVSHPTTPPRGRPSSRYPESLGRVPLHRRGTSKTYERLEDLLREAGYKETRIFTPETDRIEPEAQGRSKTDGDGEPKVDRRGSVRGGVGAVVGFLAGLMPSRNPSLHRISLDENKRDQLLPSQSPTTQLPVQPQLEYSPPTSPLVHKRSTRPQLSRPESQRFTNLASSSESLESRSTLRRTTTNVLVTGPSTPTTPTHQLIHRISQNQLPHQPQKPRLPRGQSNSSLASTITQARPSKAGAYLRHMASAPNMPKRPSSTGGNSYRSTRHATGTGPPPKLLVLNDSDAEETGQRGENEQGQPPLPPTWLETVARAVAFGGPGAYVGGPAPTTSPSDSCLYSNSNTRTAARAPALRQTRSSLSQVTITITPKMSKMTKSKGAFSDHTNKLKLSSGLYRATSSSLAPPPMCVRIQAQRSGTSEGKVSQTRVVCRSAPVSRAGSRVRGAPRSEVSVLTGEAVVDLGLGMDIGGRRKADATVFERGRGRGRQAKKRDGLPSLARTRAEGDMWGSYSGEGQPNRYLEGWEANGGGDNDDEENSSSEEEGELDLARILVPPKRQNSIRSLRKHLQVQRTGSGRDNFGKARAETRPGMGSRSATAISMWRDEEGEGGGGEDEDWGQGWRRKRSRGSQEEGEEEAHRISGLLAGNKGGRSGTGLGGKRRRGIPWAQWAGVVS